MKVKKAVKLAGNILTVLALVLIARRLILMDVDYAFLLRRDRILWILALMILYGFHIAAIPYAWCLILRITTNQKLPFLTVQKVFCKSNLLKYIPGNIFQYVGRNEIAVMFGLRHRDVALSTVLDVAANVIGVFIVSAVCYAAGFQVGLQSIGVRLSWPVVLIVLLCAGAAVLILYRKRELYLEWVKGICTRINLIRYGASVAHYMFYAVYTGLLYHAILTRVLEVQMDWDTAFLVVGAFLLSWLLGFVMPGAPGGVGVRETVIVALLAGYVQTDPVLLAIILYRIVNTVGDLLAFLGNWVACFIKSKRLCRHGDS